MDLIVAVRFGSGGYRQREARAAAGLAGGALRGGARLEKAFWGLQGSAWARVWPWRMLVARVVHLRCGLGLGRSGARSSADMAALDGEASPARGVLGAIRATAIHPSAK